MLPGSTPAATPVAGSLPLTGWLFDCYPGPGCMVVWLVDEQGRSHRLEDPFRPPFYLRGGREALRAAVRDLARAHLAEPVGMTRRQEFWSGEQVAVLQCRLLDPERQPALLRLLSVPRPGLTLYDCDLPLPLLYCHTRGIFPLAPCTVARAEDGTLAFTAHASPWDLTHREPPLTRMELEGQGDERGRGSPFGRLRRLEVRWEGRTLVLEEGDPATLLTALNRVLDEVDPHVLVTRHGDSYLLPVLLTLARQAGVPLRLDREVVRRDLSRRGRSFFSYGRVLYMAPAMPLFGRWHLDVRNSFFLSETGLAGLLELSRLAKVPVQKLARTSPGTAITSLQLERALSEGILVPWKKGEPERWKTAWELLVADKGGLVYEPLLGLYEGVGEIDFASMYPSLMVHHNISPETVGCTCCPEAATPEIGLSTCRKREGLVTKTLRPILARRARLKGLRDGAAGEARDLLDARQNALKWILVCCFGYLGYRNARFGRIEAHEAVTAHSRETLLAAMALAEARGFKVLHAIVDSLWLQKPRASEADYAALCAAIGEATGIPIALEGVYNWIAFLPSRTHPGVGVPNRFVGALCGGGLKIRGIEQRRSDTPAFVREAQEAMLAILARADGAAGFRAEVPAVLEVLAEAAARLREGRVPVEALTITKTVSQEAREYRTGSLVALASRQMAAAGVPVHPGEQVHYVITGFDKHNAGERVCALPLLTPDLTYDAAKYLEMLLEAAATLLQPAGITPAAIRQALGLPAASPRRRSGGRS